MSSHSEKEHWSAAMDSLMSLRETGTIGDVVDHLMATGYPRLPEKVYRQEREAQAWQDESGRETPDIITRVQGIRACPYSEMIALVKYLYGHTPFATKHSVKGDEFENVLVVLGRGWNQYNFDQFLELSASEATVPADRRYFFERNRNLFYVCCSRPTTRLTLLFTQELSQTSLQTLRAWFGTGHVHDVGIGQFPVKNRQA